jgi:uncharacterized phage protein (TIGR01671 family)
MKHSTLPSGPNSGNTHVVGNLSRPIKFRAWGRYGEWEEDENLDCRKWQMIDGDSLCFEEFKPVCDLLKTENDVEYFMQFTGLYDKNGKEIYEGDILKGQFTNPLAVVYENGCFCFYNDLQSGNDRLHQMRVEKLEVIGNVFENPELLG